MLGSSFSCNFWSIESGMFCGLKFESTKIQEQKKLDLLDSSKDVMQEEALVQWLCSSAITPAISSFL